MQRLLVTSAGSLVGQNLLEGLAGRRAGLEVVGLNSEPDAASNFLCDRVHLTPPLADPAFASRLAQVLALEQPHLVVPGRDDDVVFLAEWRERHRPQGTAVMVGTAAAARMLRDKRLSAQFAGAAGLPFAPTMGAEDGADAVVAQAAAWGWPVLAKPRRGNASRGVVLVGDEHQLRVVLGWPGYCVQPWLGEPPALEGLRDMLAGGMPLDWTLPGSGKVSLDGCITPAGGLVALCATRHEELRLGRSERVHALPPGDPAQALVQAFGQALAAAGWRGAFNVQLGRSASGELTAFEMNGRFTGSAATLHLLGCDFIGEALGAFLGPLPPPAAVLPTQRVDKRLANWPVPEEAVAQLRRTGRWQRG